jgi:hypothetical protein
MRWIWWAASSSLTAIGWSRQTNQFQPSEVGEFGEAAVTGGDEEAPAAQRVVDAAGVGEQHPLDGIRCWWHSQRGDVEFGQHGGGGVFGEVCYGVAGDGVVHRAAASSSAVMRERSTRWRGCPGPTTFSRSMISRRGVSSAGMRISSAVGNRLGGLRRGARA